MSIWYKSLILKYVKNKVLITDALAVVHRLSFHKLKFDVDNVISITVSYNSMSFTLVIMQSEL